MRGRTLLLALLLGSAFHTRLEASCIEPARLAHSAVSITRLFDDAERAARPGVIGASGTAWFLSPTTVVTAEHVSAGMRLSSEGWKALDVADGDDTRSIPARIARVIGTGAEKLAVIELKTGLPAARRAEIRTAPLAPDDEVTALAYPDGRRRVVGGRFVKYGDDGQLAGPALLELFDGNDRLAIDYGASGAPVFDCDGKIAAVVTTVITQTFPGVSGRIRISTAWGTPNVVSVPIQALKEYSEAR
jgi:hypothetical protein